jgi:hypothetical protein
VKIKDRAYPVAVRIEGACTGGLARKIPMAVEILFAPARHALNLAVEIPFLVMMTKLSRGSVALAAVAISKSIEAQSRLRVFTPISPPHHAQIVQHRPTRSIDPTACVNIESVVGLWRIEPAPSYPMQLDRKSDI